MAKKILSLLFFAGIGISSIQGQNGDVGSYTKAFKAYFELPRETVFLHSNKSAYVVGEDIWFKGYVYNRQKAKPFKETSNIYIGIYDSLGQPLHKKLFRSKEGFFKGNIKIDSTYVNGAYYVKAYTNWMKNFKEDDAYVQKIRIYNKSQIQTSASEDIVYDVQFLPEGGNVILGIPNTIGVKVTDQYGYGKKIKEGVILTQEEIIVKQFKNNELGLGKFKITPYPGEQYKVRITFLDGSEGTYALPKIYKEGINITLQNTSKDMLTLIINTNAETRDKIGNRSFDLLVHRDGAYKKIPIDFAQDRTNVSLLLKKELLHKGMNVITLFDDLGVPVLERLFFNAHGVDFPDVAIAATEVNSDSLELKLKINGKTQDLKNLSVSVLPRNTLSYRHPDNILSTFYLKPYLRGFVEKPMHYFQDFNAKKELKLDLLLLTQGWSKYQWTDILNTPVQETHSFEQGVRFDGIIRSKVRKGEKVFLKGTRNHTSQHLNIENSKFAVVNYFPEKGESIRIALNKKYGGYRKPDIEMAMNIAMEMDTLSYIWADDKALKVEEYDIPSSFSFVLEDNTIELNEVTVVEKKKKNELSQTNVFVPKFLKNKVTEITPEIAWNRPLFSDILRANGYQVRESLQFSAFDPQDPQSGSSANSRVDIRLRTKQSFTNAKSPQPIIYINGVRLTLFDELYRFPTSKIESYYIEKSGASEGSRGAGGVIRIFTRRDSEVESVFAQDDAARRFGDVAEGKYFEYKITEGFETEKEFYAPKYSTYKNDAFENFGVVHWTPKLVTNEKGEASFKIVNTGIKELSFFIEGMGKDGSLLSVAKHIKVVP
ncbi:hypothetical protein [Spongiimicrobium salis]|uniref:hypothetical protein n=1 Tax=Spongiimicrobium salis TaxID=1667022 RepID=UPI00374DCF87